MPYPKFYVSTPEKARQIVRRKLAKKVVNKWKKQVEKARWRRFFRHSDKTISIFNRARRSYHGRRGLGWFSRRR